MGDEVSSIANELEKEMKANEDKMDKLNRDYANTQAKINTLNRGDQDYIAAVKRLEEFFLHL